MNRPPLPINRSRVERLADDVVQHVLRRLPLDVAAAANAVRIELAWSDVLPEANEDEELLGWFEGDSLEDAEGSELPPRIVLVLDRLWEYSERRAEVFEQEVAVTLLHELGHYLGWDEDEVAARGLD
jgi:predicted Zn-dependent protease with MMP-like domain